MMYSGGMSFVMNTSVDSSICKVIHDRRDERGKGRGRGREKEKYSNEFLIIVIRQTRVTETKFVNFPL